MISLIALSALAEPEAPVGAMPDEIADALVQTRALYERVRYETPWISYVGVLDGAAVGLGAFKSPPEKGRVEIAYMTAPAHEGRGVATAIARNLVRIARNARPDIDIRTQTLPETNASVAILKKLGFTFAGDVQHPEDGLVWEWSLPAGRP